MMGCDMWGGAGLRGEGRREGVTGRGKSRGMKVGRKIKRDLGMDVGRGWGNLHRNHGSSNSGQKRQR